MNAPCRICRVFYLELRAAVTAEVDRRLFFLKIKMRVEAEAPTRMKTLESKLKLEDVTEPKLHLARLSLNADKV